jgi:hypothetical protein
LGKTLGGVALLAVAAFMLLGFAVSKLSLASPAVIFALLVSVGLPAAAGIALLKPGLLGSRRLQKSRADIRQRTLESEVLRLAAQRQGKLTIVEVVTDLAILPEEAKAVMDSLAIKGLADFAVTDSGVVVYDFQDVRKLPDKASAKGILDD